MKRYINIVKDVFKMFPGKKLVVASLFISSALGSLFSLLPPIATSGIIKVLTEQLKSKVTSDNITESKEGLEVSILDDDIVKIETINKYADNKVYETITRYKYK